MNDIRTGDLETTSMLGIGAIMLGFMAMSLFQPAQQLPPGDGEEPPPGDGNEPPPQAPVTEITGTSWEEVDYRFNWYGNSHTETAKFYKGQVGISSSQEVTAQIAIACGSAIAAVPLLTEESYQQLLTDLDGLIAGSTGKIQELWQARKGIALQFPSVDGFRIDWRWRDVDSWDRLFTQDYLLGRATDVYCWDDIRIPEGDSVVKIGFFKMHSMAISGPAVVTLLVDGVAVSSVLSDIVEYGTFPAIRSVDTPPSVESGESFNVNLSLFLPEELPGAQWYIFSLRMTGQSLGGSAEFSLGFLSTDIANHLNNLAGRIVYIPLDAPDDIYDVTIEGSAQYRARQSTYAGGSYYTDLPPGIYNLSARMQSWRVARSNGGLLVYGNFPHATYDFGIIGQVEVT